MDLFTKTAHYVVSAIASFLNGMNPTRFIIADASYLGMHCELNDYSYLNFHLHTHFYFIEKFKVLRYDQIG
jgi:hypothetical protein